MKRLVIKVRQEPPLEKILYVRRKSGCGLMTAKAMIKANPNASLDAIANAIKEADLGGRHV